MRIAYAVGLLLGLALLAAGVWLLYARFVAGPEFHLGKPDDAAARRVGGVVDDAEKRLADRQAERERLAAEVQKLGEGNPELLAQVKEKLAKSEALARQAEEGIAKARAIRKRLDDQYEKDLAEARSRTLRLGVLSTLLGIVWSVRAFAGLTRPRPRTVPAEPA